LQEYKETLQPTNLLEVLPLDLPRLTSLGSNAFMTKVHSADRKCTNVFSNVLP
jgi:hypothetical protein